MPFELAVQSWHCTWKKPPSPVLNKIIKLRPSFRQEGAKKKSPNKLGYILRPSAGNFGAIRLEKAPQQVVIVPEMSNARRRNDMPTMPKPLNSTIAWSKSLFKGYACKHGNNCAHRPFKRLYQEIRHGHRRRKRGLRRDCREVITGRVSIENLPTNIQSRKHVGDIEGTWW